MDAGFKSPPNPYRDRVHLFSDGKSPELGMSEQLKSVVNSKSLNDLPSLSRENTNSPDNSPDNNITSSDKEENIQESTRQSTLDSLPILTESSDTNSPPHRGLYSNTPTNTEINDHYVKPRASSQKEVNAAKTIERYWRNHRSRHHTSA